MEDVGRSAARVIPSLLVQTETPSTTGSFVPCGVDARSWMGFEQRIQERRFRALLDGIAVAIAAGDGHAAHAALDEARVLRPDAPELVEVADRVAALPSAIPVASSAPSFWVRALGGAGMLVIGVSLLFGIEWLRPVNAGEPLVPSPATVDVPVIVVPDGSSTNHAWQTGDVSAAALGRTDRRLQDPRNETPASDEMVPVSAVGTIGVRRIATVTAVPPQATPVAARVASTHRPSSARHMSIPPSGEIPDDYVAPQPVTPRPVVPQPRRVPEDTTARLTSSGALTTTPLARVPTRVDEKRAVTQALNQYASAYRQLDATAARAIWPSVDERALARAFAGLQSQNVAFDACDIDVRGTTANASCQGRASYVGKVGNGEQRTEPRTWEFELKRDGAAWKIENAEARRIASQVR